MGKELTWTVVWQRKKVDITKEDVHIEHKSIIWLCGNDCTYFLVFVVWHNNSSNKWFPSWPLIPEDRKKYRVGVRAVNVDLSDKSLELKNNFING